MKKKKIDEKRNKLSTDALYRLILFTVSFLLIVGVICYDKKSEDWKLNVRIGEPAPKDVYSPFNFKYINESKTEEAKRFEADQVLDIYAPDKDITKAALDDIDNFFADLAVSKNMTEESAEKESLRNIVSEPSLKMLQSESNIDFFKKLVKENVSLLMNEGLIRIDEKFDLLNEDVRTIAIQQDSGLVEIPVRELVPLESMYSRIDSLAGKSFSKNRSKRRIFTELISSFLKPNLTFDAKATRNAKEKVYAAVPPVEEEVKKDEIVLRRGKIVTHYELNRIKEIEKIITKEKVTLRVFGIGIIVFFYLSILAEYLYYFERKIYFSFKHILLINTIMIFTLVTERVVQAFPLSNNYLLPSTLAALLIGILLKPRLGILIAIGMSIFNGAMTNYDPLMIMTTLFASIGGIFSTIDLRRRSQFLKVGSFVGIIYFSLIFSYSILHEMTVREAFNESIFGLCNGLLIITPLLYIFLFIFEHLFDVTTSTTLLELSDLNHPLLKRLIIEAPGTYHHSLVVSNLAESACEAIGANSLLARVGSYFHDIGKIEKAEYFTENQTSKDKNFHDNLSPSMSYFIIAKHVKDGVELAKKYNLKQVIVDFIMQHHGTSIVYFFYKKAIDNAEDKNTINVTDYRYAGPKPQSKETAIALLADSVEAASRALSEPTPASLRGLVSKVVNDKFLDNQLDECELTLLDLHKIRESFIRNLMAIFHTRVEYPDNTNEAS